MIDGALALVLKELINANKSINSIDISKNLGISISSVKSFIKDLKPIVRKLGGELVSKPSVGYFLSGTDAFFDDVRNLLSNNVDISYSFDGRKNHILKILFNSEPNYTIQLLADDLCVGKNRIINDLVKIQNYLDQFHIHIKRQRKYGISLFGKESDIRDAMVEHNRTMTLKTDLNSIKLVRPDNLDERFSTRYYYATKEVYSVDDFIKLQEALLDAEKQLNVRYTDQSIRKILDYLLCTKQRTNRQQFITYNEYDYSTFNLKSQEKAAEYLLSKFEIRRNSYFQYEIERLCAILLCLDTQKNRNKLICSEKVDFKDFSKEYVDILENLLNIEFVEKQKLYDAINDLTTTLYYRHKLYVSLRTNMEKEVKTNCSDILGACFFVLSTIEIKPPFVPTDSDIIEYTMCIYNEITRYNKIDCVFVSAANAITTKYIVKQLNEKIDDINICYVYSLTEWKQKGLPKNVYVVMSNLCIDVPDNAFFVDCHYGKHIDESLPLIKDKIDQIKDYPFKHFIDNSVNNNIGKNLIITNSTYKTKEEIIKAGCELLQKHGYVTKDFCPDLINKEIMAPSSIGKGIAIPFGKQSYVLKPGVCIINQKKSIIWNDEDKVSLIVIAAIKSNDIITQKCISKLYLLFDDPVYINKLKNSKSIDEMHSLLTNFIK